MGRTVVGYSALKRRITRHTATYCMGRRGSITMGEIFIGWTALQHQMDLLCTVTTVEDVSLCQHGVDAKTGRGSTAVAISFLL